MFVLPLSSYLCAVTPMWKFPSKGRRVLRRHKQRKGKRWAWMPVFVCACECVCVCACVCAQCFPSSSTCCSYYYCQDYSSPFKVAIDLFCVVVLDLFCVTNLCPFWYTRWVFWLAGHVDQLFVDYLWDCKVFLLSLLLLSLKMQFPLLLASSSASLLAWTTEAKQFWARGCLITEHYHYRIHAQNNPHIMWKLMVGSSYVTIWYAMSQGISTRSHSIIALRCFMTQRWNLIFCIAHCDGWIVAGWLPVWDASQCDAS